jgi:hypothetical protein
LFLLAVETTCSVQKNPVDQDKQLYTDLAGSKAMTTDELRAWLSVREHIGKPASAEADQSNGNSQFAPQEQPSDCSHDLKEWMASLKETSTAEGAHGTSCLDGSEGARDSLSMQEDPSRHSSKTLSEKQWSANFSHAAKTAFIWQGMQTGKGSVEMQGQWNRNLMEELKSNPRFGLDPFLMNTAEKDTAYLSQVTNFSYFRPAPQKKSPLKNAAVNTRKDSAPMY